MQTPTVAGTRHALGDWGTSRLRLLLIEENRIVDRRDGPGIGALKTTPADTLTDLLSSWRNDSPFDIVLAGMAGSRTGLIETPYVSTPADARAWSRAARRTSLGDINVTVAAGLRDDSREGVSDVMRGEENQIFGGLQLDPALREGTHSVVLPGTHSKWVEVTNGRVTRFQTALTGELFGLLRDHSMLLRTGTGAETIEMDTNDGFMAGIRRSIAAGPGLVDTLFEARTAQLLRGMSHAWASGFISGILIAAEIGALSKRYPTTRGVILIGEPQLTILYESAFAHFGTQARALDGGACAIAGLQWLQASLPREMT